MSKKGENIYKRKDGRWEGRYIRYLDPNNKAKFGYVYGKSYSEVKQKLIEKKNEVLKNPDLTSKKRITYNELLNTWLAVTKINTKESTYARYVHLINTHIRPYLGEYQLVNITTQVIEDFVEQQLVNGRLDNTGGLSPKTVTDMLAVIKNTIEYARYKDLAIVCNLTKLSVKRKDKEMRVLSHSEQSALVRVLLNETDLYKFGVLLSLYTGIRVGELCALQWQDMNLLTGTLVVRKTMQRIQNTDNETDKKTKVIVTEPKSQCSIREIPLPSFIIDIAKQFSTYPDTFVLSGNSNFFIEPRTMQNRFKTYVIESGIAATNFHALRHTFATRCVEVGFELKSLSEILGHSNVNITLNRYVHSSFELKSLNMNKLSLCF